MVPTILLLTIPITIAFAISFRALGLLDGIRSVSRDRSPGVQRARRTKRRCF